MFVNKIASNVWDKIDKSWWFDQYQLVRHNHKTQTATYVVIESL